MTDWCTHRIKGFMHYGRLIPSEYELLTYTAPKTASIFEIHWGTRFKSPSEQARVSALTSVLRLSLVEHHLVLSTGITTRDKPI